MGFRTKLDFSNNRQVKQHIETLTVLSGGTSFGVPFNQLPTGPNLITVDGTFSASTVLSTFSGNSASTVYTWYNPLMEAAASNFSAITPSISAVTQVGSGFTGTSFTTIDGNQVALQYTGVTFDITPIVVYDLGGGNYSGSVQTDLAEFLIAESIDFTGRTIWADVSGFTRTQNLIVTDRPVLGNVLTCVDYEGNANWLPLSGASLLASCYWVTGTTGTYSLKAKNDTNLDATGNYALAEGYFTKAIGNNSHAEGKGTIASGTSSHAEGDTTIAGGTYSHAEGNGTTATNDGAHAEGVLTVASGYASHAEGNGSKASGESAHAEGENTEASGESAHAEGQNTLASAENSHAEGNGSKAYGFASHAEGGAVVSSISIAGGTAYGQGSHAEGVLTVASGFTSHAEGSGTTASGDYSHAQGYNTTASGQSSHAEGIQTQAGYNGHAQGFKTKATGSSSHAEGEECQALGENDHAQGYRTIASGGASHAEGSETLAIGGASHAGGVGTIASGQTSFVHGSNSIAGGAETIVLGSGITGTTANTVYVERLNIKTLAVYADNTAATSGGLEVGTVYRTSTGQLMVRY